MFQSLLGASSIIVNDFVVASSTTSGQNTGWSLGNLIQNVTKFIQTNGGYLLMAIGAAALIWCIIQAFRKYVFESQEVRMSPITMIIGAIFGAAFMYQGWQLASTIGSGLSNTATEFGNSSPNGTNAILIDYIGYEVRNALSIFGK